MVRQQNGEQRNKQTAVGNKHPVILPQVSCAHLIPSSFLPQSHTDEEPLHYRKCGWNSGKWWIPAVGKTKSDVHTLHFIHANAACRLWSIGVRQDNSEMSFNHRKTKTKEGMNQQPRVDKLGLVPLQSEHNASNRTRHLLQTQNTVRTQRSQLSSEEGRGSPSLLNTVTSWNELGSFSQIIPVWLLIMTSLPPPPPKHEIIQRCHERDIQWQFLSKLLNCSPSPTPHGHFRAIGQIPVMSVRPSQSAIPVKPKV